MLVYRRILHVYWTFIGRGVCSLCTKDSAAAYWSYWTCWILAALAHGSAMARTLRDANLGTREARARLKVRPKPFWRLLEPGLHLGYRRLAGRPGTWCVRRYTGAQTYTIERIKDVIADDFSDADGQTVLSFAQAQKVALASKPKAGPCTVADALRDYLASIEHKASHYDSVRRVEAYILPQLGGIKLAELTTARLSKWLRDVASSPPRKRTPKGEPQKFLAPDNSAEGRRRRQASTNRMYTILRSALNMAWREGRVASDAEWRKVRAFSKVTAARVRFLTIEECRRLVNASDAAFRPLVEAALCSGARYSELTRLVVSDFNSAVGTLHIRTSKSGKGRHIVLNDEGIILFKRLCAGRGSDDLLFRMAGGAPWSRSSQSTPMAAACKHARIKPCGFHTLRHSWASLSVMAGMPLAVVAKNLGHASTLMVEAHYAHLQPD